MIYWISGISFFVYCLPNQFFDLIQISSKETIYKNLGVNIVRKFAQEGDLVNHLIRKKYPLYNVIKNRKSIQRYIAKTYHFEKFHFQLLFIFLIIMAYAIRQKQYEWALLIFLNNIIFNLYPNLLQQYTRLRLKSFY